MQWMPRSEILTFEEIERIARICVERFGFDGIRLTGGEPTVRAHITTLVAKLAQLGVDLAMTTNGATLRHMRPRPPRGRASTGSTSASTRSTAPSSSR